MIEQKLDRVLALARSHFQRHAHLLKGLVALCAATVAIYATVKLGLIEPGRDDAGRRLFGYALCVVAAGLGISVRAADQPRAFRIVFRGIIALLIVYFATATPSVIIADLSWQARFELGPLRWIAVAFGIIAMLRPSFAFLALAYMPWHKAALAHALGITLTPTDYMPVVEFGFLVTISAFVIAGGRKRFGLWQPAQPDKELQPHEAVILTAVAVHFANYFYSGFRKVQIGTDPLQWVLENKTYYLALAAREVGALPLTIFGDGATTKLYDLFVALVVPMNATTLVIQLGSVLALLRLRWVILLTVFYDIMHTVIFVVSGIFFYKWIVLNGLIVAALATFRRKALPRSVVLWTAIVVFGAPILFFVAFLGWFDTPSFNDEYVVAITREGTEYRVPSNYFLSGSVTHAQGIFVRKKPGHFPVHAYGTVHYRYRNLFNAAMRCGILQGRESGVRESARQARVDDELRKHHAYIVTRLDQNGRFPYDLYPHHIFSMPWEFDDFLKLDKREIVGYRYVVKSKCLPASAEVISSKVLLRGSHVVDVRQ